LALFGITASLKRFFIIKKGVFGDRYCNTVSNEFVLNESRSSRSFYIGSKRNVIFTNGINQ